MVQDDDIKTWKIALIGGVGVIVVLIIVLALQVLYYHAAAAQFREKEIHPPLVELQTAISRQQDKLAQCQWLDRDKGVVSIPIDRAMEIVVREGGGTHAKR